MEKELRHQRISELLLRAVNTDPVNVQVPDSPLRERRVVRIDDQNTLSSRVPMAQP